MYAAYCVYLYTSIYVLVATIFSYNFCYTGYLEKLAPPLKAVYKQKRFIQRQHMWPPNQPRLFKNLTFLRHSSQFWQKQLSHLAARYRHNNKPSSTKELRFDVQNVPMFKEFEKVHLSICESNATKNIADLFSCKDESFRNILVEGAPGVGKTELIKQIAFLWARNEIISDMKVVFVLYLRDPIIQNLKSIENFIQYVNNENRYLSTKQAEGAIQELRESQGSNIAFLMDGFDEFPSQVYRGSFVAGLISGEVLPNALLLITSRPIASLFLRNQFDKVFDIAGFAKEEKEQYISESLRDMPKKQNELQEYLQQYPIINSYCYIPLYLAIVVFLLKHDCLPQTLTRINELFILHTIFRKWQQHSKKYTKLRITKLNELPNKVLHTLFCLSKLAYDGVQGSKLVFTLEEIKQICPENDDTVIATNGFGLLQAVEHDNPCSAAEVTASFNFLHYSMQEYLAALHISTLSVKDQYSVMVSIKPLHYTLSPKQCESTNVCSFWHNQFVFMWLMYVGITSGRSHAFTLFLGNSGFFISTGKASNKLRNSLNIVQILHVFQCLVEAENNKAYNSLLEHIFRDGNVCIKGTGLTNMLLFSHHILSLVFFLTKSPRPYITLEFVNCFFLDGVMNTLEEYFLSHPKKKSSFKHVHFKNSCSVSNSKILGTIIKVGYVSNITLTNVSNYDIQNIIESLNHNKNLTTLNIQEIELMDNAIELLMQQLSSNTTLKSLSIANNVCTSSGAKFVANFMGHNSTLQVLNISGNIIGLSEKLVHFFLLKHVIPQESYHDSGGIVALASVLKKNPSILSLDLSSNSIIFILELAYALYHNGVLMSLDLSNNLLYYDNQTSFNILGIALWFNKALEALNISRNGISDAKMHGVVNALYYNKTLQSLDISSNELSSHITEDLAHALEYNSYLSLLALGSNSIGDEGAIHLSSALKVNKTLASLYLRDNMITNAGAVEIAAALRENTMLRKLDVSMNDISDEGASALCSVFYIKNTLKIIFILFNPVSSKETFTKFASEDTNFNHQCHIPMTNYSYGQSVTKVSVSSSSKEVEYRQKIPVQTTGNYSLWYGTTNDKRTLAFTHGRHFYDSWKNYSYYNICLQYAYVHASINYPDNMLQEECLRGYKKTVFNVITELAQK